MATQDKFADFFDSWSEKDSEVEFKFASQAVSEQVDVISTGSHALDDALFCGGYPCGRVIQLYGKEGSGKSLLSMIAILNAQEKDPEARQIFIDAEQTFDPNWAESLGIDCNRVGLIYGDNAANGRKCFEMLLGVPKEDSKHRFSGKSKEGLLDKIAKKELNINLIVLDSLGAILPPGEDTSAVGKMNMALGSRFFSQVFRKISLELSKAKIPMIVINHAKDSMDMYGPDHTFSGGRAYRHFLSANIWLEQANSKDSRIEDENEEKIGATIRATVEKSKFGPHPRKCEFKLNFGEGIVDSHEEIIELAIKYDIVQRPTSQSYTYKETKWVGINKLTEELSTNDQLAEEWLVLIKEARTKKKAKGVVEGGDIEQVEEITEQKEDTKPSKKKKQS